MYVAEMKLLTTLRITNQMLSNTTLNFMTTKRTTNAAFISTQDGKENYTSPNFKQFNDVLDIIIIVIEQCFLTQNLGLQLVQS